MNHLHDQWREAVASHSPSDLLTIRTWIDAAYGYNKFSGAPTGSRLHIEGCSKLAKMKQENLDVEQFRRSIAATYAMGGSDWCRTCLGWADEMMKEVTKDDYRVGGSPQRKRERNMTEPERQAEMERRVREFYGVGPS